MRNILENKPKNIYMCCKKNGVIYDGKSKV